MADITNLIERLRANSDAHAIGYPKPRRQTAEELSEAADALDAKDARIAALEAALFVLPLEGQAAGWQPIESAPKDGTRFLAARWDGQGWIIGPCLWCKTPHVPLYGFHFTEGDPENWEIANPQFYQPLPAPPSSPSGDANG